MRLPVSLPFGRWRAGHGNAAERDSAEKLLAELRAAATANAPAPVDHRRYAVLARAIDELYASGRLDAAERAVRRLSKLFPASSYARSMCAIFDRLPPADGSQTDFTDDLTKEVQVVARPGSALVVLLFCGRSHRLGLPLPAIHRWLGRVPASLIYLRDFHRTEYLQGISQLGPDLETTLAELRRLIAALGGRALACYGNSSGVFPALYYGHALEAGTVVCLAGKSNRTPEFNAFTPREAKFVDLRRRYPDAILDARRLYERAARPTRIRMVYGQDNWTDRRHAEHMAPLPFVSLQPVERCAEHTVVLELIKRGEYQSLLDWLVAAA